jgi:hypothetical protein
MGSSGIDGGDASPDAPKSLSRPPSELPSDLANTSLEEGVASANSGLSALPTATTTTKLNSSLNKMSNSAVGSPSALSPSNTPLPEDAPQSHPMTASNSVSSNQDNATEKSQKSLQAYGTRSRRNRPGTGRPNYAEDHDVEMEYEQNGHANGTRDSAASDPQTAVSRQSPAPATAAAAVAAAPTQKRVTSGAAPNGWAAVNNALSNNKEPSASIPGTSTFSANPNVNVPRKRKAGGAVQNAATSHGTLQTAQTTTVSRRANASAATTGARDARQNGMYSFSKTQAKLQNGNLVADDGTVFSVNGESDLF